MRLPAPKNMANSANPITSASLFMGLPLSHAVSHIPYRPRNPLSAYERDMMTEGRPSYPLNAKAA